jgi:L-lysine 2,3-aminomutase
MNCGFAPWRLGVIADRFERIVHLARIRLSRRVPVVHPDFVAVSPGQILVIARNESVTKIDPLHVVAIEELPPSKRTDGRSARR